MRDDVGLILGECDERGLRLVQFVLALIGVGFRLADDQIEQIGDDDSILRQIDLSASLQESVRRFRGT